MFTNSDCGCYVDGCRGYYGSLRKFGQIMADHGYPDMKDAIDFEIDGSQNNELLDEIADDCLTLLQEQTEEGLCWTWQAGDLLLVAEDAL